MKILPETIHYEISLWLSYEDKISFASVNVMLSQHLLKRVRKISLDDEEEEELYMTSQSFRDKIHGLIVDPSDQLSLYVLHKRSSILEGISCFELDTSDLLIESLMHHIQKVKRLKLHSAMLSLFDGDEDSSSPPSIDTIAQWIINNPSLSVNSLIVSYSTLTDLPVIQCLQSLSIIGADLQIDGLHIPAYSNLRTLVVTNCPSIEEVSCLDRIHELHLIQCSGIRDISCLNNNYKIVIIRCNNIIDYSKSFRYSKIVDIFYVRVDCLDFSNLLKVREICITEDRKSNVKSLVLPSNPHLRQVYLKGLGCAFTLPSDNRIQIINITQCPHFDSFVQFDSIHSVYLENLQITTLEGLGSGNQVVQIRHCHFLTDFSGLRHCQKVTILDCEGFQDIRQLRGVKDFTFFPVADEELFEDLEGITCLWLENIPDDSHSIKYPKSLKRLEIMFASYDQFPSSFITSLPHHISEVKMKLSRREFDHCRDWWASIDKETFLPNFIVEFKANTIHFLRKLY